MAPILLLLIGILIFGLQLTGIYIVSLSDYLHTACICMSSLLMLSFVLAFITLRIQEKLYILWSLPRSLASELFIGPMQLVWSEIQGLSTRGKGS